MMVTMPKWLGGGGDDTQNIHKETCAAVDRLQEKARAINRVAEEIRLALRDDGANGNDKPARTRTTG